MGIKIKEVKVSKKVFERWDKDKFVQDNVDYYINKMDFLINTLKSGVNPTNTEPIGEFHVTGPKGRKERIVWHIIRDKEGNNILIIDDFVYHVTNKYYIDKWNEKARKKEIKKEDYEKAGYERISALYEKARA